jgi:uncharacterized protein YfiM (DUF2279 family)
VRPRRTLSALFLASLALPGERLGADSCLFRLFVCAPSRCLLSPRDPENDGFEILRNVSLTDASPPEAGLQLSFPRLAPVTLTESPPPTSPDAESPTAGLLRKIRPWATLFISGLAIGYSWGNSQDELPYHGTLHLTSEGFFGQNTYAGGADKAAHLVDYAVASRAMQKTYRRIGYTDSQSHWLGFATAAAAGLTTEIGDGTTIFGFSWEDLTLDVLGAAAAMGLSASGWDDTFGFRYGSVPSDPTPTCCVDNSNIGRDYSGEIYTADVKIAGLARRMKFNPGPARFLLLSMTYGTNGYNHASPEIRQRLVGLEIGIHFSEILRSLGVPSEPVWGEVLYFFFDTIRIPYTAIGVRYDLNNHEWFAPTTGRTPFRVPSGPH